jgi:hypothetical protein
VVPGRSYFPITLAVAATRNPFGMTRWTYFFCMSLPCIMTISYTVSTPLHMSYRNTHAVRSRQAQCDRWCRLLPGIPYAFVEGSIGIDMSRLPSPRDDSAGAQTEPSDYRPKTCPLSASISTIEIITYLALRHHANSSSDLLDIEH